MSRKTVDHPRLLAALIVAMSVFYIPTVVFNLLGNMPGTGLFLNTTAEISNAYFLEVTPAPWTFIIIWAVIYAWTAVWLIYALTTLIRKGANYKPLYTDPQIITTPLCLLFILNQCCNVIWMFVWDLQYIDWSLIPMALNPFTLYLCLVISFRELKKHGYSMHRNGYNKDIWMTILFVQNGIAFYATWTTIATLLNFGIMLTYRANVPQNVASTVSVSILLVEIVLWFVLESTVLDSWVRYTFSHYIVILIALSGSIAKNRNPEVTNSILTCVALGLAGLMTLVKIILVIYRHRTRPLFAASCNISPSLSE